MAENSVVDITDTFVAGNGRAGLYFKNASGSISGSVITGNSSFGLAMKDSHENMSFKEAGNYIIGNAVDMPARQAMDVTDNPGAIPVPPSIEIHDIH